jgi:glyoxylase-like metal-dependent hydrolase (beta-lactamase superfamily II)
MKPFEVANGIFMVGGPEMTDGRDGCVYLLNLRELVLIDSGAGWSVDQIRGNIERLGFDCSKLSKLILTHCHIDHIGGAPQLRDWFGVAIYIHTLDAPPLETGDRVLTAATWYNTTFPPTSVDVKFTMPKEVLTFGDDKLICLHTPGHTPGSISLYIDREGERVLFGQDLHGPILKDFGSDLSAWDRSTQKLLELDADILCEGHFGVYRSKKEVRSYIRSLRIQYKVE